MQPDTDKPGPPPAAMMVRSINTNEDPTKSNILQGCSISRTTAKTIIVFKREAA